ncbi:hypothetical protein E1B28_005689 [Marasmius oreades]|uniref:DUF6533 domain-containing protein n=1 Tax=Marasmius oreades TaxID=181124 RepID=A0A9P7S4D8_9AGAR|nr:uncharacterized protein E1B28_005689 [Marasmius oreades]KAG7094882.1 hypothetical protein E1B28_005689 [Marasmius oreades]
MAYPGSLSPDALQAIFESLESGRVAISAGYAAAALVLYDFFLTFSAELNRMWFLKKKNLVFGLFIVLRYSTIFYQVTFSMAFFLPIRSNKLRGHHIRGTSDVYLFIRDAFRYLHIADLRHLPAFHKRCRLLCFSKSRGSVPSISTVWKLQSEFCGKFCSMEHCVRRPRLRLRHDRGHSDSAQNGTNMDADQGGGDEKLVQLLLLTRRFTVLLRSRVPTTVHGHIQSDPRSFYQGGKSNDHFTNLVGPFLFSAMLIVWLETEQNLFARVAPILAQRLVLNLLSVDKILNPTLQDQTSLQTMDFALGSIIGNIGAPLEIDWEEDSEGTEGDRESPKAEEQPPYESDLEGIQMVNIGDLSYTGKKEPGGSTSGTVIRYVV